MVFRDFKSSIYLKLQKEFFETSSQLCYLKFIKSKNLGIICISFINNTYQIVDNKKWLLAKLKYGF